MPDAKAIAERANRLGIEPNAVNPELAETEYKALGAKQFKMQPDELHLSIGISLKRIADRLDDIASGAATINAYTREG